jgi:hypothetical protein
MAKKSLRQLDWAEIIMYFLEKKQSTMSERDVVDYFHFRILTGVGLNRWTSPNYIKQKPCATKLITLYGDKLTVEFIDTLFDFHKELFHKEFEEIYWSLGLLSSEKMGWLQTQVMVLWEKKKSLAPDDIILTLMKKPRKEWTTEETELFNNALKEKNNG